MSLQAAIPPDRLEPAVIEVEALLERTSRRYPQDLPVEHHARHCGWHPDPTIWKHEPGLASPLSFSGLLPLARHLAVNRCHAEALLVSERLCETMLSAPERDELTRRALGILPGSESGRLREILDCPDLAPRTIARNTANVMAAVRAVGHEYGSATALAFGQFIVAGLRKGEEFSRYGPGLDKLFHRVISAPAVARWLDEHTGAHPHDAEFLAGLAFNARTAIWQLRSPRTGPAFLLTQVIDAYLNGDSGIGTTLGLAVFDAIVLGRLGLAPQFLIAGDVVSLAIDVGNRHLYWEVSQNGPLYEEPPPDSRALELPELFALTYSSLATYLSAQGRFDKALRSYARALELKPDNCRVMIDLAACHLRHEKPVEAVKVLKQALAVATDTAEVWHQLGNAYATLTDWPRAMDAFRRALKLAPGSAEVYNNMGYAYTRMGNSSQAVAAFETAIEHQPDYYQAHFNLGNLFLEQQACDKAIEHYRAALRIEPRLTAAHYNLGRAYYEKGDLDSAIRSYQSALQYNPKHYGAWYNLGIAYRDKGMTQRAVEALEQAVVINPNLMR